MDDDARGIDDCFQTRAGHDLQPVLDLSCDPYEGQVGRGFIDRTFQDFFADVLEDLVDGLEDEAPWELVQSRLKLGAVHQPVDGRDEFKKVLSGL